MWYIRGISWGKWHYKKFFSCVSNPSVTVAMSLFWFPYHQHQIEEWWPVPYIYIYILGAGWCSTMTLDLNLGDAWFDSLLGHRLPCPRFFMTCLNAFRLTQGYYLHWTMTTLIPFQMRYLLASYHWCNTVRASESIIIVRLPWKYLFHRQCIAIICQPQKNTSLLSSEILLHMLQTTWPPTLCRKYLEGNYQHKVL